MSIATEETAPFRFTHDELRIFAVMSIESRLNFEINLDGGLINRERAIQEIHNDSQIGLRLVILEIEMALKELAKFIR